MGAGNIYSSPFVQALVYLKLEVIEISTVIRWTKLQALERVVVVIRLCVDILNHTDYYKY